VTADDQSAPESKHGIREKRLMADSGDSFLTPAAGYRDDPRRADTYVHIDADIPGIKKNFTGKAASNADIKLDLHESSFTLSVVMRSHGAVKKYRYSVKRLPGEIIIDHKKSYYRVRKDTVDLFLAKAKPGRWDTTLSSSGLDLDV